MEVAFPYPVRLRMSVPKLDGLRLSPFTNIDGEAFARPTLNGFWRVSMDVIARGMQQELALSAFVTAMSAHARCVVPICTSWRPNDENGRPLARGGIAREYTMDHVGFEAEPFPGFVLRAAAPARASYIDVNKPDLSHIWAGMHITLGNRMHQVVNVTHINEDPNAVRLSLMPNLREAHGAGTVVIVDKLRLLCQMESGDQIGVSTEPFKSARLELIEAF